MFGLHPDNNPRYGAIVEIGPTVVYTGSRSFPSFAPKTYGYNSRFGKYRQKISQGVMNHASLISVAPVYFQGHQLTPAGLGGQFTGALVTMPLLTLETNE